MPKAPSNDRAPVVSPIDLGLILAALSEALGVPPEDVPSTVIELLAERQDLLEIISLLREEISHLRQILELNSLAPPNSNT